MNYHHESYCRKCGEPRPATELDEVIQLQDALAWIDSEYRIADKERISLRAELQAIKDRDPCLHASLDYIKKTSK